MQLFLLGNLILKCSLIIYLLYLYTVFLLRDLLQIITIFAKFLFDIHLSKSGLNLACLNLAKTL